MRAKRVLGVLTATLALACCLTACGSSSSGPAANGPLSSGNSRYGPIPDGSVCAPGGRPQTFGNQTFTDYGSTAVVLDRVVLLRPYHERLIGSYALPGNSSVGTVPWPPNYAGITPAWKHRQPVHGFRLAPGSTFGMTLGIVATTPGRATSQGMLVYYHDSSGSYVAKNYFANIIAAARQKSC
jgi:hypothetical protein